MAQVKSVVNEKEKSPIQVLLEAGKRNSKKDKTAITNALAALFGTLNKSDQDEVMTNLHKKLGKKVVLKGAK